MINRVFIPPIKCQGIKSKLVSWILKNIEYKECKRWIEPFMGSGVVGFNAQHPNAIFGDINPHIVNFYNSLKSSKVTPLVVKEFLEDEGKHLEEKGAEHFYAVRERFNKFHNPLDFLFLSRSCFNGMIRFNSKGKFNVPFCRKSLRFSQSYITKIFNQVKFVYQSIKMKNWSFVCGDFRELIMKADSNDFIYCDPPYLGRHVDYYNSWGVEEENNLSKCLKNTDAKFILSTWHSNRYRANDSIERNWKEFHVLTMKHFYHIGGKEKNRNSMTEALILNYEPHNSYEHTSSSRHYQQIALF